MQIKTESTHDVLIIGSGASGGMAAHVSRRKASMLHARRRPAVDMERNRVSESCLRSSVSGIR